MAQPGSANPGSPARNAVAVDVSVVDQILATESRGIYVGTAGTLAVDMVGGGSAISFTCPAGILLPIQCSKILNTGTSATNIVALY
jgi:hypothetical protein